MPKMKPPIPVAILMSDEEFQEYHKKKQKEELLNQLIAATNSSFSVKNMGKHKESAGNTPNDLGYRTGLSLSSPDDTTSKKPVLTIDDGEFDTIKELASEFGPESPIEQVTDYTLGEFRLSDIGVKNQDDDCQHYKNLFKHEQAMLSEILRDVSEQAKWANNKLKDMTKKSAGYGGVAKTYPDLMSAANSLNTTRLNIIKEMSALKKTVVDLEMKRAKEIGPEEGENKDKLADQFFAQIVGNRKQFVESAMANAGYSTTTQNSLIPDMPRRDNDYEEEPSFEGGYGDNVPQNVPRMRSITSPLYQQEDEEKQELYYDNYAESDPYGYIRNEDRDVSICIQRFSDGRLEFVAIDGNGECVDTCELPDEDLLLSLEIRPFSNFASDEYGRRYRIIDIDKDGIDISDI